MLAFLPLQAPFPGIVVTTKFYSHPVVHSHGLRGIKALTPGIAEVQSLLLKSL